MCKEHRLVADSFVYLYTVQKTCFIIGNNQKNILNKDLLVLKILKKSIQQILPLPLFLYTLSYLSLTFLPLTKLHHTAISVTRKLKMQKIFQVI